MAINSIYDLINNEKDFFRLEILKTENAIKSCELKIKNSIKINVNFDRIKFLNLQLKNLRERLDELN